MQVEQLPVDTTVAFWQPAPPLYGGPVHALAADKAGVLYASGTGLYVRPASSPSADASWERMPSRLFTDTYTDELGDVRLFESYDRMASTGNTVYASSRTSLLRSRDQGETWTDVDRALLNFLGGGSDLWGLGASDSTLYVSMMGYGLLRSNDAGASWERVLPDPLRANARDPSADATIEQVNGLSLTYDDEGRLYALLGVEREDDPYARYGTLRLFRRGTEPSGVGDWEEMPAPPLAAQSLAATPDALYAQGLVIEDGRGSFQLYTLPSGGDSWTRISLPEWHLVRVMASTDGSLYTYGGSGLFRYDDGTWVDLRPPAKTNDLLEYDGTLWAATDRGLFVTETSEARQSTAETPPVWRAAHEGIVHAFGDLVRGPGSLVLGLDRNSAYVSRDGGMSWRKAFEGLPRFPSLIGAAIDDDGTPYVAVSRRGLYRWASDVGRWTPADTSATAKNAQSVSDGPAVVTSADGTLILAAYPRDGVEGLLHRSEGGAFVPADGLPAEGRVRGLAPHPDGALFTLIETDNVRTLYASNDDGTKWSPVAVPVPDNAELQRLTVGADGTVYLAPSGEDVALLRSHDGGATWDRLGTKGLFYTTQTGHYYRGSGVPIGTRGGHVLLQTRGLIYYWSEADARWMPLLKGLPATAGSVSVLPSGQLHAATAFGNYQSAYAVDRWIEAKARPLRRK